MKEIASIVTQDGQLVEIDKKGQQDGNNVAHIRIKFSGLSDYILAALKEQKPFTFSIRSGHAQFGISAEIFSHQLDLKRKEMVLDGQLVNLNHLLTDVLDNFQVGDDIGRLVVMDPELRVEDIYHFLHKRIFVGQASKAKEGFEVREEVDPHTGKICHYLTIDLLPYHYVLEQEALSRANINRVIKEGRFALHRLRTRLPLELQKSFLPPKQFFVGAIKISLGDFVAIIDPVTEPEEGLVRHLPAGILDPFRTVRYRQVELYNYGTEEVPLNQIKIKIRFFRATNPLSVPLKKNKIKYGYHLYDLVTITDLENIFGALKMINRRVRKEKGYGVLGIILSKGGITQVPKAKDQKSEAQNEIIKNRIAKVSSSSDDLQVLKESNGDLARILANLSVMGGISSKVFCAPVFPSDEIINVFRRNGIRTFLADQDQPVFSEDYIRRMMQLTHSETPVCEFLSYDRLSSKLLTFHHGCFMEPEDRKRFNKVKYWLAFYGSHTDKADNQLMMRFISQLVEIFGKKMGIVHGGGSGLMKESNDLARKNNIMSLGIGIDLKDQAQEVLRTCDGFICYRSGARLARQHHIEKMTNLPIINTGGYGTAEELAITVTSLKLHENPLAPVILLDPDEMWENAKKQFEKIAGNELGHEFIPRLFRTCRTAEEAVTELVSFTNDPSSWYMEHSIPIAIVKKAQQKARQLRYETLKLKNPEVFA